MIDCRTAIEKLYRYLDRDLTSNEYAEVQHHLDGCPPCAKYFKFEEGVLRFVTQVGRQQCAPQSLKDKIERMCAERNSAVSILAQGDEPE